MTGATVAAPRIGDHADGWTRFWFAPESAEVLALLRIFFGIALLLEITGATGLYRLPHLAAELPRHFAGPAEYALDAVRLPVPGFEWLPAPSYLGFRALEIALVPLCVLFISGLFARWVGPTLAVLYLYRFLLSQFFYHHHVLVLVVGLVVIGFARCAEHYSLDAYLAGPDREPRLSRALPRRLLQVFVPIIYLASVAQKLNDSWLSGRFIEILHETERIQGPVAAAIMGLGAYRQLGIIAMATELFLAVALAIPALQLAGLWVGTAFHLGIDLVLPVGAYSYAMLALYLSYLRPGAARTTVLYDGRCGFCGRSMRAARLLDWFRRVHWLDVHDPATRAAVPASTIAEAGSTMVALTPDGARHRGFFAWRAVWRRYPLTFMLAPLLHVPPVPWIGQRVYAWIASRRHHVCRVPAAAPRDRIEMASISILPER